MSDRHPHDSPDGEPGAQAIVDSAAARLLGRRPCLRELSGVAWSAFLGATVSLSVALLMPEDWLEVPLRFGRLAVIFAVLWALALVPALSQALLSRPRPEPRDVG